MCFYGSPLFRNGVRVVNMHCALALSISTVVEPPIRVAQIFDLGLVLWYPVYGLSDKLGSFQDLTVTFHPRKLFGLNSKVK
jgi:hypothetical protein